MAHKDEFRLHRLSASFNEWVPVFRAQPAAMNKMAFKAFFITAFSPRDTTAPASDMFWIDILDRFFSIFKITLPRVQSATVCKPKRSVCGPESCVQLGFRTTWWWKGVNCGPEYQGSCIEIVISSQIFGHLRSRPKPDFLPVLLWFSFFLWINCSQSLFFAQLCNRFCKYYGIFIFKSIVA